MAFRPKQVPISSKNNHAARLAHARASQEFKTYDTSAIKPKPSKAPFIVLGVIVIAIIVAAVLVFRSCSETDGPVLAEGEEAIITVAQGEGARNIANDLADAHLIGNVNKFLDLIDSRNAASSLIPGTYLFSGGMTSDEILDALLEGPAATGVAITIPEGYTREAIAEAVAAGTGNSISRSDFLLASENASVYAAEYPFLVDAGQNSLEGFLFPKTYTVTAVDTAETLVRMMLSQFQSETAGLDWSYPASVGLTQYDAVKLASVVEKESNSESMPTIASVFYNRLASDRPYLESDATTAYEVGHDPTADEVHAETPYSTYTNPGLPPTPICNPSLTALQAVCSPEQTDYMFFFTNSDGTHEFSRTYDEHQAAIN